MKQITPYLFFEGNCAEVMTFYQECFDGELSIMKISDSPKASEMSPEMQNKVMHAAIMKDKQLVLMASDTMMPDQTAEMGEGVYNTIICSTKDELKSLFEKLSAGGKVSMPLAEEFFGMFGSLTDKFGVKWMLEFDNPKE